MLGGKAELVSSSGSIALGFDACQPEGGAFPYQAPYGCKVVSFRFPPSNNVETSPLPLFLSCQLIISAPSLPASADAISSHHLSRSLFTAQAHSHNGSGEDRLLPWTYECSWRGRLELDSSTFHPLTNIPSMFCLIELKTAVREYGCSHTSLFMNPREITEWEGEQVIFDMSLTSPMGS